MKIAIAGCGWLGLPLGVKLVAEGHAVKGSTTTTGKLKQLENHNMEPYMLKIEAEGVEGDIASFLEKAEMLIINIPPGLRRNRKANFIGKIRTLIGHIENSSVERVIFVSSTSVYKDMPQFPVYTEEIAPNGTSEAAKQLISAEEQLQSKHFKTTIIRFGGLIGPDRHPVKYLAGKTGIKNPKAPINLIHQEDCIGIISEIIRKNVGNATFNAAYPQHTSKEEYYTQRAKEIGLELPNFEHFSSSEGKIIDSVRLQRELDYTFKKSV